MNSSATRSDKDYIVNRRKVYVANSHVGDLHGVVIRIGPGSKDLSAFLIEKDHPNFSLAPHQPSMGLNGFSWSKSMFGNCHVSKENLLGKKKDGLAVALGITRRNGRFLF